MVALQIKSVNADIGLDAIKLGMLFSAETISEIASTFASLFSLSDHLPIVVDPVCVSTSGHSLLPSSAVDTLKAELLPWATVLTPNIPEAILLTSWEGGVDSVDDMRRLARKVGQLGRNWVYLKGGHAPLEGKEEGGKVVVDILWGKEGEVEILSERVWIESTSTHGTGCSLSSAVAANLAKGFSGGTIPSVPFSSRC